MVEKQERSNRLVSWYALLIEYSFDFILPIYHLGMIPNKVYYFDLIMKDFLSMYSNQTVAERPFSSDKKKKEETFFLILGKQWSELQDSLIVFLQQNKLVYHIY